MSRRGTITDILAVLIQLQGWMHGLLGAEMASFAAHRNWTLLVAMLPLGVLFGAVHALTPGHGKILLAAYLVSSPLSALRSLMVAAAQALTHVGTAVVIALAALPLITRTLGGVGRAPSIERLSSALLISIGLWMLVQVVRGRGHAHPAREGVMVGVIAGLVPCPLTLFAMVMAIGRGVPEAGLTFAVAMLLGVGLTLCGVALLATLARGSVVALTVRYGRSLAMLTRATDLVAGVLLTAVGLHQLTA